jgi:HEAT repeat protein
MNSVGFLLLFALTAAVTFVVVLLAVSLVIHKAVDVARTLVRRKLYDIYSQAAATVLLSEIPIEVRSGKPSEHFAYYDLLLQPLKHDLSVDSKTYLNIKRATLKTVLLDYSQDLSGEARERLTYCFYALGFVDEEIRSMLNRRWWIRANAARALGQFRTRRGMFVLTEALDDRREEVRSQAMKSLIALVGPEALRVILQRAKGISRWQAIELSAEIMKFKQESVPPLLEALSFSDPSVVEFAIEMLAEVGFVDALESIRKIARDGTSVALQLKAIEALGRLGDTRGELLLLQLTLDPDVRIRTKAMDALARIGTPGAAEFVLERVAAGDLPEKIVAVTALNRLGERGKRIVGDLLAGPEPLLRAVAAHVVDGASLSEA